MKADLIDIPAVEVPLPLPEETVSYNNEAAETTVEIAVSPDTSVSDGESFSFALPIFIAAAAIILSALLISILSKGNSVKDK